MKSSSISVFRLTVWLRKSPRIFNLGLLFFFVFFFQLGLISYGWTHDFSQEVPGLTLTICNKIIVRILQDANWFHQTFVGIHFL